MSPLEREEPPPPTWWARIWICLLFCEILDGLNPSDPRTREVSSWLGNYSNTAFPFSAFQRIDVVLTVHSTLEPVGRAPGSDRIVQENQRGGKKRQLTAQLRVRRPAH